jgi:hypothetical protein
MTPAQKARAQFLRLVASIPPVPMRSRFDQKRVDAADKKAVDLTQQERAQQIEDRFIEQQRYARETREALPHIFRSK